MKALVRALWADKLTFVALVLFLLILVGSLIGPWLLPHSPTAQNLLGRNLPPFSPHPRGEFPHILGTDHSVVTFWPGCSPPAGSRSSSPSSK